jgi:orotidine-5'-phosphate decarboxylase
MKTNAVVAKLEARVKAVGSLLCVGLDPETAKMPERFRGGAEPLFEFGKWIIEETHEFAAAYKPNMAFYEAHGARGIAQLERTVQYLRAEHPEIVTVCDAKRADIGNTNRGYVEAIFDGMGFDAVTLHPYLGREALMPFLERRDKVSIVLCRTSNAGAGELQDLPVEADDGVVRLLWECVAARVATEWNEHGNVMLVVGATYPGEMRRVRELAPQMWFLVPGLGAQGGDVQAAVDAGRFPGPDAQGAGLLLSSSRGILYAGSPRAAARALRDEIEAARGVANAAR